MSNLSIHCRYDKLVPVEELRPYPKNRNIHPQDQIERLSEIIRYQGVRAPLIVANAPYDCIAKGHGTLDALKLLGATHAPVVFQDFEDEDQLYYFVQSDNAIAVWAEIDLKAINADIPLLSGQVPIELLGIKDFTLDMAEKNEGNGDPDAVPGNVETRVKPGELWLLGNHRLLCGDSTKREDVNLLMGGEKADMLCWDPPWNVDFEYNEYQDDRSTEEFGAFLKSCLTNFEANANNSFVSIVWQSEKNRTHAHKWFPKEARMVAVLKNFVQLSNSYLQRAWDPAFIWHGRDYEFVKVEGHNQRDYLIANTAATIQTDYRVISGQHPCPRTVDTYEYFISGWSALGANVVDLCAGSGTILIAGEKTGRRCFGMEIDPHYCDVIIERWEKYTGKKAIRSDCEATSEQAQ